MLKLRLYSDLHNEFSLFNIPITDDEENTILILAGDIFAPKRICNWISQFNNRFRKVLLVLGNHDYWTSSIELTPTRIKSELSKLNLDNVHLLDNESITIDGVRFYGGTMWTSFNDKDPVTTLFHPSMNDVRKIRADKYKRPITWYDLYSRFVTFNERLVADIANNPDVPTVVISHHAPHYLSIAEYYRCDRYTVGLYSSDQSEMILDNPSIKLWIHGHTHNTSMYPIGDCLVVCNPRGYTKSSEDVDVEDFDPRLMIGISELGEIVQFINT